MDVLRDKAGLSNIRLIILVFVVLSGIAAALLYFPPISTRTAPLKTSGEIKFMDSAGNPLSGAISLSGEGVSSGPPKPNVNLISWTQIPNAIINYDAFATKSLSINLRISGDSPKGRVVLENYGTSLPGSVNITAPGTPVKYVEINSSGVSFADADISIKYTDAEVSGLDVNNLAIYQYDGVLQAWNELSTSLDTGNNILTATVNTLGFFAVSTRIPQGIDVHDTKKISIMGNIKIYDEAKTLKKEAKTDKLSTTDVPDRGELEVDALDSKNVAVKLKVSKAGRGEIILDDFGKRNPAPVPLPGMAVKFVEIGASGISFSSADITIRYTDADLNGGSEDALTIYHWNGASWDAMPTTIDTVNKTLSASTASLSLWGVATLYQEALRCDSGTSIGTSDTTDTACATASFTVFSTGLLLDPAGTTGGYISFANFAGERLYGYFVDNTAYSTDVNITGVNGSMSMRLGATGITAYGKYQVGYYNPNGAADNFVGLFNSTDTSGITTITQTKYTVSFYAANNSAIIPKNMKLAIRVWTRTSASGTTRFYLYRTTAAYASLFNYTLAYPNSSISGYVTNKSSGLPLSGATVQTNTSLTTTTNASGGYNFTGLSNGTYNINASLTNYAVNSINVTINNNNNNTANISLTPLPTYLLSGYVTNASNLAAIPSATVTTNTSQTTSTNATGFYNFTLSNGTYLITASKSGYDGNSTTRTVNGAAVSNANITLTPTPPVSGKILVATNRYVILDDPRAGTAGTNFSTPGPGYDWTTWNYWSGKNTQINATVLYIDNNGFPVSGKNITFTLYNPGGGVNSTNYSTTNTLGLANFSFDLNGANYYGKWQIIAGYGTLNDSTTFIYNWWGCGTGQSTCSNSASAHPNNPSTVTNVSANSPYLNGKDATTSSSYATQHDTSGNCTICHQSFDGLPGGNTLAANHTDNTSDVHRNVSGGCRNANCHGSYTTHDTNQVIGSCYNASGGCHGNGSAWDRKDLSNKSTLNSTNVATALSEYSINSTDFNATFHTPNSTVPCIICHGPMHNITKPDPLQTVRNNNTEDSQCKTCHSSYNEHNSSNVTSGGVNCTLCHSDDVHDIQVFAQNATYVDLNHDNPNSARGNCTNCHQNATFFVALEKQPKAGNYTGRDPPIIPVPLNHSTDPMSGALWNGSQSAYWDNTSQKSACYYCHGLSTLHSASALGSISNVKGTNSLNQDLTTSRWCANCHYKNAPDYAGNTSFSPEPPEILNASGKVPATSRDGTTFTNHSNYFTSGYNDSVCKNCHNNNLSASATSLNFSHNVAIGSGGAPNCIQCHNLVTGLSGGAPVGINFTAANASVHNGTNANNATSQGYAPVIGACWACHDTDGNVTSKHPDKYKTPKTCLDCHLASGTYYTQSQSWGGPTVSEHYYGGDQIAAGNSSSNISSCINCHENVSEMIIYNNDTDTGQSFVGDGIRLVGGNMSFYHYGKDRSDIRTGATANCSYCHRNTNTAFNIAMLDRAYSSNVSNHSMSYSSTNPDCSQCHNSGWIHNSTLTKPNLTLPNSTYCLTCHGTPGNSSTTIKNLSRHNSALNCTDCHLNTSRSIHPVRYLQQDGTNFSTQKTGAVNCTTCHQGSGLNNFSSAPIIPTPMNHSTNPYNGSLWNSTPGYWTNTSQQTACNYCHNNSALHNTSGLGNITKVQAGNSKNQSLSGGYWCANCHYNGSAASGNYNYKGNLFSPQPPEVYNQTGLVPQKANDGITNFFNHSGSLATYDDDRCRNCHNSFLGAGATSLNFSHDVRAGGGGPNCTQCHDITGSGAPTDKRINATAMRLGVHQNLNSNATNTTPIDNLSKACWACHGSGTQPTGHPDNYKSPYECIDCHNRTANTSIANTNITWKKVYDHIQQPYAESIYADAWNPAVNCYLCHNKSTVYFNVTFTTANPLKANVSHYANKSNLISNTTNCTLCHKSPTNSVEWYANLTRHPAKSQDVGFCANCHNSTNITTFH
ncbi:MAG: carboxypeptidase regulatory-like domain-containing protein, partial [Candidatus Methanoperedens sp.]